MHVALNAGSATTGPGRIRYHGRDRVSIRTGLGPRQVVPHTATALIVLASQVNRHLVSLPQKSSLTLGVRVTESVPDSNTSLLERRILEGIGVTCVDASHRTWE